VSQTEPIAWNKQAFDLLALEKSKKEMLLAALNGSSTGGKQTLGLEISIKTRSGLILLFHGDSGTGKTFAAEGVAELMEKPLQRISIVEAGTSANELERIIRIAGFLAVSWGSVALFDDVDALLERRTISDMARNAAVTAFIRILDELDGLIILTTNRDSAIDNALRSRIHLAIRFERLNHDKQQIIWENRLRMAAAQLEEDVDIGDIMERIGELADCGLNGRQMQNIVIPCAGDTFNA
jgi:SpoVK/Ycf46/Vps4 family AAA+-type ATPase